jgi:hypothetical protein
MRVIILIITSLFVINCTYSQTGSMADSHDTTSLNARNSFSITFRMIPELEKFEKRYYILSNTNENLHAVEVSYDLQNSITSANFNDSSILKGYNYLKNNWSNRCPNKS